VSALIWWAKGLRVWGLEPGEPRAGGGALVDEALAV